MTLYDQAMHNANSVEMPDILVQNEGSLVLFYPNSQEGADWLNDNIEPNAQRWNEGVVVEHRYAHDIARGLQRDGLTMELPGPWWTITL